MRLLFQRPCPAKQGQSGADRRTLAAQCLPHKPGFRLSSRACWLAPALAVAALMAPVSPVAAKPLGLDPHVCQMSMNLCEHRCGPPNHNIHRLECNSECLAAERQCLRQVALNNALQHPPPPSLSTPGSGMGTVHLPKGQGNGKGPAGGAR